MSETLPALRLLRTARPGRGACKSTELVYESSPTASMHLWPPCGASSRRLERTSHVTPSGRRRSRGSLPPGISGRVTHLRRHVQHPHTTKSRRCRVHPRPAGTSSEARTCHRRLTPPAGPFVRAACTSSSSTSSRHLADVTGPRTPRVLLTTAPPWDGSGAARHALAWRTLWRTTHPRRAARAAGVGRSAVLALPRRPGRLQHCPPAETTHAGKIFWDADTWMYPGLLCLTRTRARDAGVPLHADERRVANAARLDSRASSFRGRAQRRRCSPECHSVVRRTAGRRSTSGDIACRLSLYLARGRRLLRSRGGPCSRNRHSVPARDGNADGSYS